MNDNTENQQSYPQQGQPNVYQQQAGPQQGYLNQGQPNVYQQQAGSQQGYPNQGQPGVYQQQSGPQQGYPQQGKPQKKSNTGLMIGIIIGSIVLLGILIVVGVFRMIKKGMDYAMDSSSSTTEEFTIPEITEFEFNTEENIEDEFTPSEEEVSSEGVTDDITEETTEAVTEAETTEAVTESSSNSQLTVASFSEDVFKNHKWYETNSDSYLVPEGDSFKYYKEKAVLDDYYYSGHYKLYVGKQAYDYVTGDPDMAQYAVTAEDLDGLFERNEQYSVDNLVCIVLDNEECIVEGKNTQDGNIITPYYGFYVGQDGKEYLYIVNMNSPEYYNFLKED